VDRGGAGALFRIRFAVAEREGLAPEQQRQQGQRHQHPGPFGPADEQIGHQRQQSEHARQLWSGNQPEQRDDGQRPEATAEQIERVATANRHTRHLQQQQTECCPHRQHGGQQTQHAEYDRGRGEVLAGTYDTAHAGRDEDRGRKQQRRQPRDAWPGQGDPDAGRPDAEHGDRD
jgi:hypothetical protein